MLRIAVFGLALFVALDVAAGQFRPWTRPVDKGPPARPGDIDTLSANVPFSGLSVEQVDRFLANPRSAGALALCFKQFDTCPSPATKSLIRQIMGLGRNGNCGRDCSPEEQQYVNELLSRLVNGMAKASPEPFSQIIPFIRERVQHVIQPSPGSAQARPWTRPVDKGAPSRPGDINTLSANQGFSGLSVEQVQRFLGNDRSVNALAHCFNQFQNCPSPATKNLIQQIMALGRNGNCGPNCGQAEQAYVNELLTMLVTGLSRNYPNQFGLIYPHIRERVAHIVQGNQG